MLPPELTAIKTSHTPGYEVTRDGRVFSVATNWRGYGRREMSQDPNDDGYPSVRILVNGKRRRIAVHILVAREYLPARPSPSHEVRHLDGNRLNSKADNLAWGTRKENADDRERHGRTSRGNRHSAAIRASNQAEGTRAFRRSQREASNV
jgi:hypothetical protein